MVVLISMRRNHYNHVTMTTGKDSEDNIVPSSSIIMHGEGLERLLSKAKNH